MSTRFVCIGAQKAGTTWLHRVLSLHHQIWLPPIKELHYFDEIYIRQGGYVSRLKRLKQLAKDYIDALEAGKDGQQSPELAVKRQRFTDLAKLMVVTSDREYASYFEVGARGKACAGDITPAYSALPPEGFARIRHVFPAVKVLFVMRDPIDRLWSAIRHDAAVQGVLPEEMAVRTTRSKTFTIPSRSDYQRTIAAMAQGGIANPKIYLFEEFFSSPRDGLTNLLEWLEIDSKINPQMEAAIPNQVNKGTEQAAPDEFIRIMREQLGSIYDFAHQQGFPVRKYWRWQVD